MTIPLRAFVLLLRFNGLRIGDAVGLSRDRITGNKLFLRTQKTGVHVYCPLPDFVIEALDSISGLRPHYFWSGQSDLEGASRNYMRYLKTLFFLAGIPNGHAHRFRDTFAVELLLSGVPIERLSVLLGHTSIRVTEKHYAPWVRARQEQLEADVAHSWQRDALAFTLTKGTYKVRDEKAAVN